MGWDPAPRFRDLWGNDYVGLDLVDAENLAGVLWRLHELISSPPVYGELVENLPPAQLRHLVDGLEESLSWVDHLLKPTSSGEAADP